MGDLYKPETDHIKQPRGESTMAGFFEWAQRVCEKGGVREIRLETAEFVLAWRLPDATAKAELEKVEK